MPVSNQLNLPAPTISNSKRKSKRTWIYLEHKYFYNQKETRTHLLSLLNTLRNIPLPSSLPILSKELQNLDLQFVEFVFRLIKHEQYNWEDALELYDLYIYTPFFYDLGEGPFNKFELMVAFEKSRDRVYRKIHRRILGLEKRPLYGSQQIIFDLEEELKRLKGQEGYVAFQEITNQIKFLSKNTLDQKQLLPILKKLKTWFLEYAHPQLGQGRKPASLGLEFLEIANCAALSCMPEKEVKPSSSKLYKKIEKLAFAVEKKLRRWYNEPNDQFPAFG